MKLKQYIFDYLRKRMPERECRFPHMDRSLKVMLIYESDVLERNDAIKAIRQDMLRRQMDVTMWGYVEKKDIQTLILPQSRILGVGDYNLLGKPRDYVLTDLQAEHYDLLIDLTTRPLSAIEVKASFCVIAREHAPGDKHFSIIVFVASGCCITSSVDRTP